MKKTIILIYLCGIIILQSCAAVAVKGRVSAVAPENEIVVNPELREFFKKNPNPRVVLRVPSTTSNVTASESEKNSDYNSLYGRIEKELMKEGYTVRDRNMLNSILSSGQNLSYKEIGAKIETDIIIEIVSITSSKISDDSKEITFEQTVFPSTNKLLPDKKKLINELDRLMNNVLVVENYTVDCKVVLVNEGTTVGMFTFNYCNCSEATSPCAIEVRTNKAGKEYWITPEAEILIVRTEGETKWYAGVNFVAKLNDISEILAHDLVKILRGKD
jgi:hypothetical protein